VAASGTGTREPETFSFLGFTHLCAETKTGRFWVRRITIAKRMRTKLREVKEQLKRRWHEPIPEQGQWLKSVVQGHLAYYAVPGNTDAVATFRTQVGTALVQGAAAPQPAHPPQLDTDGPHHETMVTTRPPTASLPRRALRRQNPRQEPSAVIPHAGICAGAARKGGPYRDPLSNRSSYRASRP
jgi:hypothetical protein